MTTILREGDLEFDFSDAIDGIKFDDATHCLSHCMKAVDFVVELDEKYLFVEVKDPAHPRARPQNQAGFQEDTLDGTLRNEIVTKFRDSFLYRWAENKLDKPVIFLSLVTLDEGMVNYFQDEIKRSLPLSGSERWTRNIAQACIVVNLDAWNRNFARWPVHRLSSAQQ